MNKMLFITIILLLTVQLSGYAQEVTPPNGEPGKCYAKCIIPDEYEEITEKVLVRAASKKVEVIPAEYKTISEKVLTKAETRRLIEVPAVYETVMEKVLVQEESKRLVPVPAVYETVTERVLVRPESKKLIPVSSEFSTGPEQYIIKESTTKIESVPALYETLTEQIQTAPASTRWEKRKSNQNCLSADPEDCLVWCLVEIPAEYKTVTKRIRQGCPPGYTDNGEDCTREIEIPAVYGTREVKRVRSEATTREEIIPAVYETVEVKKIKTPATFREEIIPAVYKEVPKKVMVKPATTREEVIPAEYKTIKKQVVAVPATTRTIDIPAKYETVNRKQLVKKGGYTEWKEVLCVDKITSQIVRTVQAALRKAGFDPGPIDNILGPLTKAALVRYQKANSLPVGNLDIETLDALGIDY